MDISLHIHIPHYEPHKKIIDIASEIKRITGRTIHVSIDSKRPNSPGFAIFPTEYPDIGLITIGASFIETPYLDIIVSHEILHLFLRCNGFPVFHWQSIDDDYFGSSIDSAIHHPIIIKLQKESMKIDPYPFIMADIKQNMQHAFKIKCVGYKRIEEKCRIKSIIFLADRLNWGIDHADFKKAVRAYKKGFPVGHDKAYKIAQIIRSFLNKQKYGDAEQCILDICDVLGIGLNYHVTQITY